MKNWKAGSWVVMIGVLHTLVMFVLAGDYLMGMAADGWVSAIEPDPMRMAAFWSLFFGFVLVGYGFALREIEAAQGGPSRLHAWTLAAIAIAGGLAIPASGFWLALGPAALLFRNSSVALTPARLSAP